MYSIIGSNNTNWEKLIEYSKTAMGKVLSVTSAGWTNYPDESVCDRTDGWYDYMLIIVEKGELEFKINGKPVIVGPSNIVFMTPQSKYSFHSRLGSQHSFMHFTAEGLTNYFGLSEGIYQVSGFTRLKTLIDELVTVLNTPSPYKFELSTVSGMSVLTEAARLIVPREQNEVHTDMPLKLLSASCLGSATIKEIAKRVGMSEAEFSKHIKEKTGVTPKEYMMRQRIMIIKKRIANEPQSLLKDIALHAGGYQNYQYFVRVFRRYTGLTPKEYRDRIEKENTGN